MMDFKVCFSVLLGLILGYLFQESCNSINKNIRL